MCAAALEDDVLDAAERDQVRGVEGSVGHVEIFRRTVSVGVAVLEDLAPRPATVPRTPAPLSTPKSRFPAHTSGADDG